jgi:polyketide synthase PksM
MKNKDEVVIDLKEIIAEETGIQIKDIQDSDSFFNLGLDSVRCIFVMEKLEVKYGITLNPISFWDYPSVDNYADFLVQEYL